MGRRLYPNYHFVGQQNDPIILPNGYSLSIVMGSAKYQIKLRTILLNGQAKTPTSTDYSILFGMIKHKRTYAFDINIGIAYQSLTYPDYSTRSQVIINNKQIGFVAEASCNLSTPHIGISPFMFTNINAKTISIGVGTRVQLGKVGYTKKQFARI